MKYSMPSILEHSPPRQSIDAKQIGVQKEKYLWAAALCPAKNYREK